MTNIDRRTGFATAYGLYYETAGQGDWIVFLHSGLADARMWDDQFAHFSATFSVLRYDFQGYGRSKLTNKKVDHIADMVQVLDTLGVRDCHLVGSSLGGGVALDFAVRYPERVNSLVLIGSSVSGYVPPEEVTPPPQWDTAVAAFKKGDLDLTSELELQIWLDGVGRTPADVDPEVRRRLHQMNKMNLRAEKYWGRREAENNIAAYEHLKQIKVPTLAMVGELDQPDVIELTAKLAIEMPNARKVLISDTAHFPNMEKPAEVNQILRDFWRELA